MRFQTFPIALAIALSIPLACDGPASKPADARYTVRGEIAQLPKTPSREVFVHHESIPDFRDLRGRRTGMSSMTMPFHLDESIDASTLAAGDRVELDLEVRWSDRAPLRIVRVARLPAGTRLEFDSAPHPDTAEPGSPESLR